MDVDEEDDVDASRTSRWCLDDLIVSDQVLLGRSRPSHANLMELVADLSKEWCDRSVSMPDMIAWSMDRMALPYDAMWFMDDFEEAYKKRRYQYNQLVRLLTQGGVLDPDHDDYETTHEAMTSVDRVMAAVYNTVFHAFVAYNRVDGIRNMRNPLGDMDEETVDFHDDDHLTNYQKLVLVLCKRFEAKKYRKADGCCFRAIVTRDGHSTLAYEFANTIEREVYGLEKEVKFEHWKLLTNPPNNARLAIEYLIKSDQYEFRSLDVGDGDWYSFRNGIYNIRHDLFFRFEERPDWPRYAVEMAEARGEPQPYPHPMEGTTVCVNQFDIPFRYDISPNNPDVPFPMDIPTPSMDSIFDAQEFCEETKHWAYAFAGRSFFRPNRLENWQRALFAIGQGQTGKSTLLNWLAYVVPPHFHSVLNSNFEPQFGLSGIAKDEKRLCLCFELTEEMSMRQEEFQNCVEATVVQPATKGVTAERHHFKQHIVLAGNQWPRKWKNNRGQISRRAFTLLYKKVVPKDQIRGDLAAELIADTDALLRKCSIAYVYKADAYGNKDLMASGILPEQIHGFINDMTSQIDPFKAFVGSEEFVVAPTAYMPVDEFKRMYADWRKANGFSVQPWVPEHYDHTFQVKGITISNTRMTYLGEEMHAPFLFGIGLKPTALTSESPSS
jgi:hypothetical protein